MAESTWASSVVGICTTRTPRLQDRSGEACKVADNAPAKGNHAIAPLDAEFEKRLAQLRQHGKALARFPGSDDG